MAQRVSVSKLALEELKEYANNLRRIIDAEFGIPPVVSGDQFNQLVVALDEQPV